MALLLLLLQCNYWQTATTTTLRRLHRDVSDDLDYRSKAALDCCRRLQLLAKQSWSVYAVQHNRPVPVACCCTVSDTVSCPETNRSPDTVSSAQPQSVAAAVDDDSGASLKVSSNLWDDHRQLQRRQNRLTAFKWRGNGVAAFQWKLKKMKQNN